MAAFEILPMGAEHCDGRGYVHHTAWQQTYRGLLPETVLEAQTLDRCIAIARANLQNHETPTLVAVMGQKVVGFVCYTPAAGTVDALYVLQEVQGEGIGKALLRDALEAMSGKPTRLYMLETNARALEWYRRQGFVWTGKKQTVTTSRGSFTELELRRN